jgi:hypothetical protein
MIQLPLHCETDITKRVCPPTTLATKYNIKRYNYHVYRAAGFTNHVQFMSPFTAQNYIIQTCYETAFKFNSQVSLANIKHGIIILMLVFICYPPTLPILNHATSQSRFIVLSCDI